MKRLVVLMLALLTVLSMLACCSQSNESADSLFQSTISSDTVSYTDASSSNTLTEDVDSNNNDDIKNYTVNGVSFDRYKIVRPKYNFSYIAQLEIDKLVASINEISSYKLEVLTDDKSENEYEIIIGDCNRQKLDKLSNLEGFTVKIDGKKIYLQGGTQYATAVAVSELGRRIEKGELTDSDSFSGVYSEAIRNYDLSKYYNYKWGDDFSSDFIDSTKWNIIGEEYQTKGADGKSGQHGKNAYRSDDPKNIYIKDGCFVVSGTYDDNNYYGGTLRTYHKLQFKYGFLETSAKMPHGDGFWAGMWLCSLESNGIVGPEIDMNEMFGDSSWFAPNAHVWPTSRGTSELGYKHRSLDNIYGTNKRNYLNDANGKTFKDDFHTYGFLWTENDLIFTCDGNEYCSYSYSDQPDYLEAFSTVKLYINLSFTPGVCNSPLAQNATEDEWKSSNRYITDYVHLYQMDTPLFELSCEPNRDGK